MAVGGCVVAVALFSFTRFHSTVDAARDFRAKSTRSRKTFAGCNVSSPTTQRVITLQGEPIGAGAEGWVYKAKDQNGRFAAVKLIDKETDQEAEFKNLQKLSSVSSLHINKFEPGFGDVKTCFVSQPGCQPKPCLVTEFIDGQDLATRFFSDRRGLTMGDDLDDNEKLDYSSGKISYQLLRSILFQTLTAFRDTERAGLCNNDQHLGNIMLDREDKIVFIDFGYATETRPCPPSTNFGDSEGLGATLQCFPTLKFLLANETDRLAYSASCTRLSNTNPKTYSTAELALRGEALSDDPGVFFNLHPDEIITKQRKELNETGSPYIRPDSSLSETGSQYIRPVSNPGPLKDDVAKVQPVHQKALSLGL
mmetsp:Transcript_14664/g.28894  ORF Transcript_14664/g.28894 Transcript_14664/m.28894 type:complete len:366 (+) Transcript_14664:64-1161(+)